MASTHTGLALLLSTPPGTPNSQTSAWLTALLPAQLLSHQNVSPDHIIQTEPTLALSIPLTCFLFPKILIFTWTYYIQHSVDLHLECKLYEGKSNTLCSLMSNAVLTRNH